jgi:hypothetical protein
MLPGWISARASRAAGAIGRHILDLIRRSDKDQKRHPAARKVLLVSKVLVYRQQHVVAQDFGGIEQLAVLFPFQSCPFGCVRFVDGKAVA